MRRPPVGLLFALALLALSSLASANAAATHFEGQTFAPIQPFEETHVRIAKEDLSFVLFDDVQQARVTAAYALENPTDEAVSTDVAFAYVDGENKDRDPGAVVTLDGAALPFKMIVDVDLDAGADAARLREAWSKLTTNRYRRLAWFVFHLDVAPRQSRKLTVAYDQLADVELAARANALCEYDYLLSPAKHWAGFGALTVTIRAPGTDIETDLPSTREGDVTTLHFDKLPEGELVFRAISKEGLWFGLESTKGYWMILVLALVAMESFFARFMGRHVVATRKKPLTRALAAIFLAMPVATLAGVAVMMLLLSLYPKFALGGGYDPAFGCMAALFVLAVGSVVIALAASKRARTLP